MNTILEGSCALMPFYTDLRTVFKAFGGRQREFNWLLTDIEFSWLRTDIELSLEGRELPPELTLHLGKTTYEFPEAVWLTGERLREIVENYNLQFIWSVLSGFESTIDIDPHNLESHPFAAGNRAFWQDSPKIQHPRASVEIVCWDSSYTLLLSKDDDLTEKFRGFFPEARDLDTFNRIRELQ